MNNIACWNIRGLNGTEKQVEVKKLISDHKLSCLGLIETKNLVAYKDRICSVVAPNWHFVDNFDLAPLGRVLVGWDPNIWNILVLSKNSQGISCLVKSVSSSVEANISFVYGANLVDDRRMLWDYIISNSGLLSSKPWLVIGDFNAIRVPSESIGGSNVWGPSYDEFPSCIENANLDDLRYRGLFFSWSNNSPENLIQRKLDRALVNDRWFTSFIDSEAIFLPPGISDHSPILVKIAPSSASKPKPFKFYNHWVDFHEFLPTVEMAWASNFTGSRLFVVYKKLFLVKQALNLLPVLKKLKPRLRRRS